MKILALITARGGSKRLPGKNIRPLGGKPLIVWSIEAARLLPEVVDIHVSTDDAAIAEVARAHGALVPWLRPAELATDTATSLDACLHALDWYEAERAAVDGLLLLQPTSPFRSAQSMRRGVELFKENPHGAVLGVSPAASHPLWCLRMDNGRVVPYQQGGSDLRSQDLPPVYVSNGAFYLLAPEHLRRTRSFTQDAVALVMDDPLESVDIDTEWDWRLAELLLPMAGEQGLASKEK